MVVSNTASDGSGTWTNLVGWTTYSNGTTITYCPTESGWYTTCWRFPSCAGYSVAEPSLTYVTTCSSSCTDCTNQKTIINVSHSINM